MAKAFVIDVALCSGCYSCQVACKDEHCGNDWTPYAKPQPDIGQFWVKVNEDVQGTIPKVRVAYTPALCNHCERPACLAACASNAVYKRADGLVIIDPEKCVFCGKCKDACPYGAIYQNEELNICQKCTGCAHLLDNGYAEPRCSEICPTGALVFGEEAELEELIRGAQTMRPETGLGPKVYYRNIPGKFIAGTVYDPEAEEILEFAVVTAVSGGKIVRVLTDDFGDFWLNDLAVGAWDVAITAEGYEPKYFNALRTDTSLNLGEIALERKKE